MAQQVKVGRMHTSLQILLLLLLLVYLVVVVDLSFFSFEDGIPVRIELPGTSLPGYISNNIYTVYPFPPSSESLFLYTFLLSLRRMERARVMAMSSGARNRTVNHLCIKRTMWASVIPSPTICQPKGASFLLFKRLHVSITLPESLKRKDVTISGREKKWNM